LSSRKTKAAKRRKITAHVASRGKTQSQNNKPQSGARFQPTARAVGKHKVKTTSRVAAKDNSPGLQSWESEKKNGTKSRRDGTATPPRATNQGPKGLTVEKTKAAKRRKISAHGASRGKTQSQNNKPRSGERK
jgi:hypothetical protein